MLFSKWTLRKPNPQESQLLQRERGIPAILADILAARELSPYQISELFDGAFELEDPMLLPDMAQAVRRIEKGIDAGEQIAVYGDYDCDGVTATAMLYSYLQSIGGNVCYYIPKRLGEGYGMNCNAINQLHEQGVTLIVTVDNGISAIEEIAYAAELGIDVVVTDHHQIGERLPQAAAGLSQPEGNCREGVIKMAGRAAALCGGAAHNAP